MPSEEHADLCAPANDPEDEIKSLEEVPERAKAAAQPFDRRGRGRRYSDGLTDEEWASANLRQCEEGYLILDLANVLRIVERHPEFVGRYLYDVNMHKVIDNGVIMVQWQVDALAGEIQERFMPGVNEALVQKAVDVAANKTMLGITVCTNSKDG